MRGVRAHHYHYHNRALASPPSIPPVAGPAPPVRAGMWPYPNHVHQGSHTINVMVPRLMRDPVFNDYKRELDARYPSHLSDFDNYVHGLGFSKQGHKLQFTVIMKRKSFPLANRNGRTFAQDEAYRLQIDVTGHVTINANTYIGVGYAVRTLQQLLQPDGAGGCQISHLPVNIVDKPNTHRRTVMLDTARNFFSVKSICRVLQQMGANKMNKFDWHISDDQSFPLNVGPITNIFSVKASSDPAFAGMTGAFHPSKSYGMADVKRIIGTARNYGIFVEPSIDSPGHCSALMYGSKEACLRVIGKPTQIIANWELVWGGSLNAPEPVIGYLDVLDDKKCTDVVRVMHSIFQEVYDAFGMSSGRYGRHFNIAADEVSEQTIPADKYSAYLNKLLNIFTTLPWSQVEIAMWIDPVLRLNVSPPGANAHI